ncbi:MAG: vitamin K epoxide reductase [Anaerolineales bacterium]|nr:vitamin K epoxide reductase [Anaerolineales bacterium]
MKKTFSAIFLVIVILFLPSLSVHAQETTPVVHAVLFHSPSCGHCQYVITETILPMMEEYGAQLQIVGVDVSTEDGNALFMSALQTFNVERAGVPFLVIDDIYLIGSVDIPEKFPALVDSYLAQGGVGLPNIPGFSEALNQPSAGDSTTDEAQPQNTDEAPQSTLTPATESPASSPTIETPGTPFSGIHDLHWTERFAQDPVGNTLSVVVLVGMFGALFWAVFYIRYGSPVKISETMPAWIFPLLCVIGAGVAGYLAFIETTQTTAVCGPVGDCNTVQQSEYARLFGILPIGVLGLFGYLVIFVSWLVTQYGRKKLARLASLALFFLTLSGTLFSIYLTFLEPFIIGATCAWCLTSAIVMTALFLLTAKPAKGALIQMRI